MVTNVCDIRAMGARPHGIVDMLVAPDKDFAEQVLDGLDWAADTLGVPILGGHLTLGHPPALSATATGFTRAPLRATAARPGDTLLAAFALDGRYMSDANDFFTALRDRPKHLLQTDGEALVEVAEAGFAHAARDIWMPGIAGSLLQMIEGAGVGATLTSTRSPDPTTSPLERWLLTFPSFGFLLAAGDERAVRVFARARPGLRTLRHVRRLTPAQTQRRHQHGRRLGPQHHQAHRPNGIAIGWCRAPW